MGKRLVCVAKGRLEWQAYEEPALRPGQVRIRAHFAAAKHGTEMAFYKGYGTERGSFDAAYGLFRKQGTDKSPYPFAVGNMIVGIVEETGVDVERVSVGDRVCVYSGFRETCVADQKACWRLPAEMPWQAAVCLDPADFGLGAVRDGHVRLGDAVAVFGLGAIGLMALQCARLAGAAPVIGIDPLANRREVALHLGADQVLDPRSTDVGLALKEATDRRGVDVTIDYSGAGPAVQQALRGIAYGGTVVLGSFPPPYGPGLDLGAEAHLNIPNVVFSRACSQPDRDHPRWDNDRLYAVCWKLLCEAKLVGEPIVQPVVPFGTLVEEYPKIASQPEHNIKLGVSYG